jgi:hypothetical protein
MRRHIGDALAIDPDAAAVTNGVTILSTCTDHANLLMDKISTEGIVQ